MQSTSAKENKFLGMASRMLRRKGFYREKQKPIFIRHTVGIGGVYVENVPRGYLLRVRSFGFDSVFDSVSDLRRVIEQLDDIDRKETMAWRQRIAQYGKEAEEQ